MKEAHDLKASVVMQYSGKSGFRFIDCIAEWITKSDPPLGYGHVRVDKHGDVHIKLSYVAGLVGGALECEIYPEQFGIPCKKGTVYRFYLPPKVTLDACVQAIREELQPPEYVI